MALTRRQRARAFRYGVYATSVAAVVAVALFVDWDKLSGALFQWDLVTEQFPEILTRAARNTLIFTVFGFIGGLGMGLLFALMRLSSVRPYRWFAATYIEIFRGIPLLVTLLLLGFGIPIATGWRWPNPYLQGVVPLSLVASWPRCSLFPTIPPSSCSRLLPALLPSHWLSALSSAAS